MKMCLCIIKDSNLYGQPEARGLKASIKKVELLHMEAANYKGADLQADFSCCCWQMA